ncbi:hypothetical protein PoB_003857500 [Plakobranchus ocellatus]|uniref:Uncharacterized protein n=1 Tax=Plakobranchus ocellatus TaxID=259542 RepID=A0AAV4AUQ3_9GAST|nr:hypothetical protein PoB_003857500 [Plakobranchus ocellatus]
MSARMSEVPEEYAPKLRPWGQFLQLSHTPLAKRVEEANAATSKLARDPSVVRKAALRRVDLRHRGNPIVVMGETTLEFGIYQGQTFRWALENATGWVVALVASEVAETPQTSNIGINKGLLMQYASHFPKVREEVDFRKALNASVAKVKATGDVGFTLVRFGQYRGLSWKDLVLSKAKDHQSFCSNLLQNKAVDPKSTMGQLQNYIKEATSSTSSDQSQGLTELSISSPAEFPLLKAVTRQTPASSTERLLSLKEMVPADEDELTLVQLRQEVEAKEVVAADTTTDRPTSGELQMKSFTESTPVNKCTACCLYYMPREMLVA